MASTKEYLEFVLEQLSALDEISSRAMMGEYVRMFLPFFSFRKYAEVDR